MIRCKFVCTKVSTSTFGTPGGKSDVLDEAVFNAIMDGTEENKEFFKWTPSGTLNIGTHRQGSFKAGQAYYIDITPAEG